MRLLAGLAVVVGIWSAPALADFDALLTAARTGDLQAVQALLAAGDDPNPPEYHHGYAPLQFAAEHGDAEMTKALLDAGANTEYRDHNGDRALLWAAYSGTVETVRLLLDAGSPPDSNADPYGETPLMTAATYGKVDIALLLLSAGADPHRRDQTGSTALHLAARYEDPRLVNALLAAGANPNVFGDILYETPLHEAAVRGSPAAIAALVAADAGLEPRNSDGLTPLHLAAAIGNGQGVVALIAAGAKWDAKAPDGRTPVLSALASLGPEDGKQVAIDALAKVTEDIDRAFAVALGRGMIPVAMRLLERGADVNAVDDEGVSALANAARLSGMTMFRVLVDRGADITRFGPETLLMAAANGNAGVVSNLLERGVPIESRDSYGRTPLLQAVWNGQVKMVELLLTSGADRNARDSSGDGTAELLAVVTRPLEFEIERRGQSRSYRPTDELELDLSYLRENRAAIRVLLAAE